MSSERNSENAQEALNQSKKALQDISVLRDQIRRLRLTVRSLWELLKKTNNFTEVELIKIFKDMNEEELQSGKKGEICKSCGRTLQENSRICIYCGTETELKPFA